MTPVHPPPGETHEMPANWLSLTSLPVVLVVVAWLGDRIARAIFNGVIRRIA